MNDDIINIDSINTNAQGTELTMSNGNVYNAYKESINQVAKKTEKFDPLVANFPLFGFGSLLYGLFFCFCLYKNLSGITSPFICIATIAYYILCFKALNIPRKKSDAFFIISTILLGISNMLTLSYVLLFFNYCGIILLLFVYLIRHFYKTDSWTFTKYFSTLVLSMCCSVSHIFSPFIALKKYTKEKENRKISILSYILIGLVISVPLLIIICSLLLSADAVFKNLADYLFSDIINLIKPSSIFLLVFTTCFGLCASFGLLAEMIEKRVNEEVKDTRVHEPVIAITFTSILTIIYLVFSVIQILYLFIGNMQLPKGYTYANYAREGFFQLLFVCLINLVLVLICMGIFKENIVLKVILTIICFCTTIMIASSCMRMMLYIDSYGLTFLRVFVLLALLVILLCLIGVVVSIYKRSFPLFTYMLVVVSVCYILFSLAKPDYWIAEYNINYTYNARSTDSYLYDLSPDAAPVLVRNKFFRGFTKEEFEMIGSWKSWDEYYLYRDKNYAKIIKIHPCDYSTYYFIYQSMNHYKHLNVRNFNVSAYLAGKAFMTSSN